jgi:hypothetical protein
LPPPAGRVSRSSPVSSPVSSKSQKCSVAVKWHSRDGRHHPEYWVRLRRSRMEWGSGAGGQTPHGHRAGRGWMDGHRNSVDVIIKMKTLCAERKLLLAGMFSKSRHCDQFSLKLPGRMRSDSKIRLSNQCLRSPRVTRSQLKLSAGCGSI